MPPFPIESFVTVLFIAVIVLFIVIVWVLVIAFFALVVPRLLKALERF